MSEPLSGRIVEHGGPANPGGAGAGGSDGPADPSGRSIIPPRWAKAWLVPVIFGVLSLALGVLVLVWPGHTIGALTILFGVYLLVTGGYRFVHAIQLRGVEPVARAVALVLSALSAVVGVVCLINPFNTAATFAVVAGAFWLAAGAITVFGGWQRRGRPMQAGRAPSVAGGVCSMIIGLLIVLFPHASLLFLAMVLGFWLAFVGVSAIATGFTARRLLKNVTASVLYWP